MDRSVQYADAEAARRFLAAEQATNVTSCSATLDYLGAGSDPEISPHESARIIAAYPYDQWTTYTPYPRARIEALYVNLSEGMLHTSFFTKEDTGTVPTSELTEHVLVGSAAISDTNADADIEDESEIFLDLAAHPKGVLSREMVALPAKGAEKGPWRVTLSTDFLESDEL